MKIFILLLTLALVSACATPTMITIERKAEDGTFVTVDITADPKVWKDMRMDYNGTWHTFTLAAGSVGPAPNPWAESINNALEFAVPVAMCQISPLMCPPKPPVVNGVPIPID